MNGLMEDIGITFRIMCHNQYNFFSPKMVMYKNGNVSRNMKNNEVCNHTYKDHANIAYNTDPPFFDVDPKTKSMIMYSERYESNTQDSISREWEILDSFFNQNDIIPNFINCYLDRGVFNSSSGKHSGAIGKVL